MVVQTAKFKQAITDSKKLKAKPTDDELLEVRCHFYYPADSNLIQFSCLACRIILCGLTSLIVLSSMHFLSKALKRQSSRMPRSQAPSTSRYATHQKMVAQIRSFQIRSLIAMLNVLGTQPADSPIGDALGQVQVQCLEEDRRREGHSRPVTDQIR